jgi:hypothetical protein
MKLNVRLNIVKTVLLLCTAAFTLTAAYAADEPICDTKAWRYSIKNWDNSPYNRKNLKSDFKNSPKNPHNRENSLTRLNVFGGLLNSKLGYAVVRTQPTLKIDQFRQAGTKRQHGQAAHFEEAYLNLFNEKGERIGYSPDGRCFFDEEGDETAFAIKPNE